MKIVKVTVGLSTSVKVAPYEYSKPEYILTAELQEGDTVESVTDELKKLVSAELTAITEKLLA